MSCGCGRRRKKSLTTRQKGNIRNRSKQLILEKQAKTKSQHIKNKIIKSRLNICEKCPHSVQTDRDKKYKIKLCHKQNRPLNIVSKTLSSACPIGKFKDSI